MCAGLSSRFGGKIKQFATVGPNGETLIEISMDQAISGGAEKIIFIVGEKTEAPFKEKFGDSYKGIPIFYAKQEFNSAERDKPWGTCDALISAKPYIDGPFVVCNGDDLYGETSFAYMFNSAPFETSATLGYKLETVLPATGSVNRGIFKVDQNSYVQEICETLNIEKSKVAEMGLSLNVLTSQNIFCLKPEHLALLEEQLNKFKESHAGDRKSECYLPVELSSLIGQKKLKMVLFNAPDKWIGVTNPDDEITVREYLRQQS